MKLKGRVLLPNARKIVVVEDDATLRMLLVDALSEIGATAIAFDTADKALAYLLETDVCCPLLIVDHGLPGHFQGAELITQVKMKWPSIGAILMSGYLLEPETIPSSTLYLQKPWSLESFIMAVTSLLQPGYPLRKCC